MASSNQNENVGVALALVFGAGASTGIGAAVVFIPSLVKIASRRVLASSLGFSAGVMTYVSFIEIFNKSADSFENAGHPPDKAYIYATLCFFGGVLAMLVRTEHEFLKKRRREPGGFVESIVAIVVENEVCVLSIFFFVKL